MKNKRRLIIFIITALLLFILDKTTGFSAELFSETRIAGFKLMIEDNFLKAFLIYFLISVPACVLLALPGITFAVTAGILFGAVKGTLACLAATVAGAGLSFLAGRYFLQDAIKPKLAKNKVLRRILFEEADKSDFYLLMLTRLLPIFPFNLQNFAYGISDIAFGKYMLYSAIFMLPGTAVYTFAAAGVVDSEKRGSYFAAAAVIFILLSLTGIILKKRLEKSGAEECEAAEPESDEFRTDKTERAES